MRRTAIHAAVAAAAAMGALAAHAQTSYICRSANGTSFQSTRPCPPIVRYYGPVNGDSSYTAPIPRVGEAPSNLKYLSPRCASLNDAIRTAPARGLKYETIREMHKEYARECGDSEHEAQSRLADDRKSMQQQRAEAQNSEKMERERASLREQQCGESKRILFSKRARTDLTEGEKAELRRFEDNYRSRCG